MKGTTYPYKDQPDRESYIGNTEHEIPFQEYSDKGFSRFSLHAELWPRTGKAVMVRQAIHSLRLTGWLICSKNPAKQIHHLFQMVTLKREFQSYVCIHNVIIWICNVISISKIFWTNQRKDRQWDPYVRYFIYWIHVRKCRSEKDKLQTINHIKLKMNHFEVIATSSRLLKMITYKSLCPQGQGRHLFWDCIKYPAHVPENLWESGKSTHHLPVCEELSKNKEASGNPGRWTC